MQSFNKKRENFNNFYIDAIFVTQIDSVAPPTCTPLPLPPNHILIH